MDTKSANDRRWEDPQTGENSPVTDGEDDMVVENELDEVPATVDANGLETVDANAPALVEARKIRVRTWSERTRRILVTMVVAALFGVAGYFLRPQSATSAPEAQDLMQQVRDELRRSIVAQKQLETGLTSAKSKIETVQQELTQAKTAEAEAAGRFQQAEQRIADLKADLQTAKSEVEPTLKKLETAETAAAENKAAAEAAAQRADALQEQIEKATAERDRLDLERQCLTEARQRLEMDVSAKMQRQQELVDLLAVLDLGSADGKSPLASSPGEMPITAREMVRCMGVPTLVFEQKGEVSMQWGKDHTAVANGDIVVTIDGKPATRGMLAQMATRPGEQNESPAPWRVGPDQALKYPVLVELFGMPERVAGTGARFTAWWPAGAWGRDVSATVVEGVVTEIDGKDVDPAKVCALVRQRAAAYAKVTPVVQAETARAEEAYRQAAEVVEARLSRHAELRGRDGEKLVRWEMAPFESVGSWVGPCVSDAAAWTVRAAVTGTWQTGDGTTTVERRFVIVTVRQGPEGLKTLDYAMHAPRE